MLEWLDHLPFGWFIGIGIIILAITWFAYEIHSATPLEEEEDRLR